jgi:iron complex outermembrane receptor protein
MSKVSPSIGVHFDLTRALGLYANVATSLETPTTTELNNQPDGSGGFNQELDPQESVSVEAGLRGRIGHSLTFEAAAFRTELQDQLIPFESSLQEGRTFFRNAGTSLYKGLEAALAFRRGLFSSRITFTHTNARFDDYLGDGDNLSGNRVPGLAPNRAEAVLGVSHPRGFVEARLLWSDDVQVNDSNTARADSYWVTDLRGGLDQFELGRLRVSPFAGITNLFDQEYVSSVAVNAFGGRFFEPAPSRSVYVGLEIGGAGI